MKRSLLLLAILTVTVCGHSMTREQTKFSAFLWSVGYGQERSWSEVSTTGSMRPVLDVGMITLLQRATAADLHVGDIAHYTVNADGSGEKTIEHRVKSINRNGWVYFAGDHNRYSDGWIAPCRIRWRVVRILNLDS